MGRDSKYQIRMKKQGKLTLNLYAKLNTRKLRLKTLRLSKVDIRVF